MKSRFTRHITIRNDVFNRGDRQRRIKDGNFAEIRVESYLRGERTPARLLTVTRARNLRERGFRETSSPRNSRDRNSPTARAKHVSSIAKIDSRYPRRAARNSDLFRCGFRRCTKPKESRVPGGCTIRTEVSTLLETPLSTGYLVNYYYYYRCRCYVARVAPPTPGDDSENVDENSGYRTIIVTAGNFSVSKFSVRTRFVRSQKRSAKVAYEIFRSRENRK